MAIGKLTLADLDVDGRRVLVRVDFNVPLGDDGEVSNDARIRATIPTLRHILDGGGIPILMTHLGRPGGKVVDSLRLDPLVPVLSKLLDCKVRKADDCVGDVASRVVKTASPGEAVLLENLRFHAEETKDDPEFAAKLASLGERYVNDAFGTSHRAHASISGVTKHMPSAAGYLLEKEIASFQKALHAPDRPFAAVLGGAKVSDKILVIENLLGRVDHLLIGGGMTYTFLAAQGIATGTSRVETDRLDVARAILARVSQSNVQLHLPVDHVVADRFADDAEHQTVGQAIPDGWMALDIGPQTLARYREILAQSRTIVWNGPMGVFEWRAFRAGTEGVAQAVAANESAFTVVGGGDSVAALELLDLADRVTHVSTGGGAALELLEGKTLPGIAALTDRPSA